MNTRCMIIVAAVAVTFVGATAPSTTDSAFAGKKKYEKSQAASQVNECDNGEQPLNVFCSNSASQNQGDENAVTTASEHAEG